MNGFFVKGFLSGMDRKVYRQDDGTLKDRYIYLVVCGVDAYRVTSDQDYTDSVTLGQEVTFMIRCRAFNNSVYYTGGELVL